MWHGFIYICSVEHATLVGGDHVLNVNECIISSVRFKQLEGLHDQVAQILGFALTVIDCIALVQVFGLVEVHDRQNLTIVGHQGLANRVTGRNKRLQDVQSCRDNLMVTSVQCSYRNNRSKHE